MRPRALTRRSEALSLLLSLGAHAGLLAAFTWSWWSAPEPERILEVEYLPSPGEPAPIAATVLAPAARQAPLASPRPPEQPPPPTTPPQLPAPVDPPGRTARIATAPTARSLSRLAAREREPEPIIECRVRIASLEVTFPARDPDRPWLMARVEREQLAEERLERGSPVGLPERPRTLEEAAEAARTEPARAEPDTRTAPAPRTAADARAAPEFPFVPHAHGAEQALSEELDPALLALPLEGDRRLLDSIQARIDAISPLVHATAQGCKHHRGTARLRFLINPRGYPLGYQLERSTGSACLDRRLDEVLHLAEPYPRARGWVPVYVRFEPGAGPADGVQPSPGPSSSSRPAEPQAMP